MTIESFLPVLGFDKAYKISESGLVYSIARTIKRSDGTFQTFKSKEVKTHISQKGYRMIHLSVNGKSVGRTVHSILVETFILKSPIPKGMCVNHKDGNKLNNDLKNLEVTTYSGNTIHAIKNNLTKNHGETHYNAKLSTVQVEEIRELEKQGKSRRQIAKIYEVNRVTIKDILNGKKRVNG